MVKLPMPDSQKSSDDLNVGSSKWHLAVAEEIDIEAKLETDKELSRCLKEKAEFHRLIAQYQK